MKLPGKITAATVFHNHLFIACEGGRTFMWVNDDWRSLDYDPPPATGMNAGPPFIQNMRVGEKA